MPYVIRIVMSVVVLISLASTVDASFYDRIKERAENNSTDDTTQKKSVSVNSPPEAKAKAKGISVQSKGQLEGNAGVSASDPQTATVMKADSNTPQN